MKITPEIVSRYQATGTAYSAPCLICGGKFGTCHDVDDTAPIVARLRKLGTAGRKAILEKGSK